MCFPCASIPAIALSVVGTPAAGAAYMGLQAMGETAFDAKQRGASDGQALTLGVATGVISGALSMIPMGNLSSYSGAISGTVKAAAGSALKDVALVSTKKILSSVFLNAATSAINQAANELVDTAIMGNLSHYSVAVKNNMANGMTEKDARAKAFKDNMWNIVKLAGTGAVQGLVMGSIGLGVEAAKAGVGKIAGKVTGKAGTLEQGTPVTGKVSPEQSPLTEQQTADAVAGKPVQVEAKAEPKTEIPEETLVNEIMPKAVEGKPIDIDELNIGKVLENKENSGTIEEKSDQSQPVANQKNIDEFISGTKSFEDALHDYSALYAEKVNSNQRWQWDEDIFGADRLTRTQRSKIKEAAVNNGYIPDVKTYKIDGKTHADFKNAGVVKKTDTLPEKMWHLSDDIQFKWLDERIGGHKSDHTWHHTETPGVMELVPFGIHNVTFHNGGRTSGMWADAAR